jgi:hypothetical protein
MTPVFSFFTLTRRAGRSPLAFAGLAPAGLAAAMGCAMMLVTTASRATLVVHDLNTAGDGLLVSDTATGLDWVSPRATAGVSYNTVVAGYDGFVTTGGYSVATGAQVQAMFANNFNNPTTTQSAANVPKVQAFFNVFGITEQLNCPSTTPPGACPRTQAWSVPSPGNIEALGMVMIGNGAAGYVNDFTGTVTADGAITDPQFGTWLVRPTPAAGCTVTAPANGTLGSCPAVLASGSSCAFACNTGYVVQGAQTSCSSGTLTAQTCAPSPCTVTPPTNGALGNCPSVLASGSSCQVACNPGFTAVGPATSCSFGGLTAQSCAGPAPATPAMGPWGTLALAALLGASSLLSRKRAAPRRDD